jgi:hypothetical protein
MDRSLFLTCHYSSLRYGRPIRLITRHSKTHRWVQKRRYSLPGACAPNGEFPEPDQRDLPCPVLLPKIFRFARRANQNYKLRRPVLLRGALAIVTNVGAGCGGRGSVGCGTRLQGGLPVSNRHHARRTTPKPGEAFWRRRVAVYGKTVWSWHPLLVLNRRRCCEPNRARQHLQSADDGDKTNSSPGRARHKP